MLRTNSQTPPPEGQNQNPPVNDLRRTPDGTSLSSRPCFYHPTPSRNIKSPHPKQTHNRPLSPPWLPLEIKQVESVDGDESKIRSCTPSR